MQVARVTSGGKVTIPDEIRKALDIHQGDDLVFELGQSGTASIRVVLERRRLTDLGGALRHSRPYPGKDAVREEVGFEIGRQMVADRES